MLSGLLRQTGGSKPSRYRRPLTLSAPRRILLPLLRCGIGVPRDIRQDLLKNPEYRRGLAASSGSCSGKPIARQRRGCELKLLQLPLQRGGDSQVVQHAGTQFGRCGGLFDAVSEFASIRRSAG